MGSSVEETSSMMNIIIPQEWSEAAKTVASTPSLPVTFVCGPKNSGKTIFSRHLVNVLLQRYERVAYLDTDVGQTEFTPPGCLSLTVIDKITPDLTIPCLKTPVRCYFFGDISPKRDPTMYLKYISALYDYYEKEFNRFDPSGHTALPLVVNTSGWVKGIGFDILVDMLKYISPTHMVQIRISAESKNLPTGGFWLDERDDSSATLIEISSARQDSLKRSVLVQKDARLLRDLRIMAYFRQCFSSEMDITTIKELARSLAAHPPYEVPVSSVKIKHLHNEVPNSEVFYSLNATIVGLAVSSEDNDHLPCCVGLGIVRSIDTLKKIIYVITPVPHNTLEKVDLLLQGFIQIPNSLLQMTTSIADELYSEILEQSNGEMSSKSTSLANHFNSSDSHEDDLWNEDGLSWNGSNNESEKESDLDREWQRRRDQFHTTGYRDGLIAGKEASAQEGFNIGFSESVFVGYKWGLVRGVSSALACLPDEVKKRLVESEEQRNKFLHLHESVDDLSTSDALKLFHDDMSNSVEKQKDHPLPTSHKEKEHTSGSNDNLLETYYEDMQALILESPALKVHFEISK